MDSNQLLLLPDDGGSKAELRAAGSRYGLRSAGAADFTEG
nr:hypothetical protein Itr_chr09CG03860 [Ipomoea trifida]